MATTSSSIDPSTLPNPFTPLAFLEPKLAFQASFTVYVVVCCLAIIIWDILHTLSADYTMAFKQRFTMPTLVYLVSKYTTLGYMIGKCIQLTAELPNCHIVETIMCAFYTLTHATTGLLLYLRVCAVYGNHPIIRIFFGLTWLGVTGTAALTFASFVGVHVGSTQFCSSRVTQKFVVTPWWMDLVNDTLVFLAIMWKLSSGAGDRVEESTGHRKDSGGSKDRYSGGAAWSDSQIFYLIAVAMNFATIITYFAANNPPDSPFRIMLVFPNTTIVNIMACRVYRNLKVGRPGLLPAPSTTPGAVEPEGDQGPGTRVNFNVCSTRVDSMAPGTVYSMRNLQGKRGLGLVEAEDITPDTLKNEFVVLEDGKVDSAEEQTLRNIERKFRKTSPFTPESHF
ncbi:hypothetical protein NLJ89_g5156 [Agrocybe chaxingu]|uniref:DUF6533 domain-containing protein n=1 Tax=Agrocybe chaxingu TaxID=84603 RepID=A0A9W8MV98_9AGAR|nr:hypothetical protein NLJ89_g5156 [Agrocybe chaxingu]